MGWVVRLLRQPELALYWRMLQLPKVIGHRGATAYAPENTLASFREARRRGATWVETDVKLTADGVPIVMHDDSLKRTTGVDRLVAETPRAELPEDVPTFEEAIACFGRAGAGLQRRDQALRGPRGRDRAHGVETLRRCWPRPSAAAVAVELQGRLAGRRPSGRAGVRARRADRRAGRRLARRGRRRWGRPASTPTASSCTAVRAVEVQQGGLRAQRLHHQRWRRRPKRWSAWGSTASSPTRPT